MSTYFNQLPPAGGFINGQEHYYQAIRSPFGERLTARMIERKLSGVRLAKLAGLARGHTNLLISGYYHPSAVTAQRLADALGLPFDELWAVVQDSKQRWGRRHKAKAGRRGQGFKMFRCAYLDKDVDRWIAEMAKPQPGRRGRSVSGIINSVLRQAMMSEVTI